MKNCFHTITTILVVSLLTGCAYDPAKQTVIVPATSAATIRTSAADDAMLVIKTFQNMSPAELNTAKELARDAFERDPATFRRMRYLLALFVSPPAPADDDRLLALVEPLVSAGESRQTADGIIAIIAQQSAVARKRLREELAAQRSRAGTVAASNATKREDRDGEIRSLRAKVDELEKQLAAMKSIERSVTRR